MQDVEYSIEVFGLFDRSDIGRFFHHAHETLIACGARTVGTGIDVGDVVAYGTETKIGFHVADGRGESLGIFVAGAQDVKGEPLCTFAADAWQLFQFIDEPRHRLGKLGHRLNKVTSEPIRPAISEQTSIEAAEKNWKRAGCKVPESHSPGSPIPPSIPPTVDCMA